MNEPVSVTSMIEQDRQISEIVAGEHSRLRNFIRRRVPDPSDAEDILQEVFYELDGHSFKEMAAETGVSVNTLLSRKRYSMLHLRERLQSVYDEYRKA